MRKIKYLIIIVLIIGGLVLIVNQAFLYCGSTHSPLTREVAKFYNHYYDPDITPEQMEWMRKGSVDEDLSPRCWFYHFYDPIRNRGFGGLSAKEWAQSPEEQAGKPGGDHTWQTAIAEYNAGYKQKAFYSLGHVLHLIEDMAVPAHTREDDHISGDPLESWAGDLPENSVFYNIAEPLINQGTKPRIFSNLDVYFDEMANFSNNNFFSKDTIHETTIDRYGRIKPDAKYLGPKIVKEVFYTDKEGYAYGRIDGYSKLIRLAKIRKNDNGTKFYFIKDKYTYENSPEIHAEYLQLLAREAVINSAGVVKLFFDSIVEPEEEIVELEKKLSFFQKIINKIKDGVKFVYSAIDGLFHVPGYAIDSLIRSVAPEPEHLTTSPWIFDETVKLKEKGGAKSPNIPPNGDFALPFSNTETFPQPYEEITWQVQSPIEVSKIESLKLPEVDETEEAPIEVPTDVGTEIGKEIEEIFVVKEVIDGDTIVLENGQEVRYIGINAPESPNGCFAQEATNENKRLIEGRQIRLEKDISETDSYGRLLRYVYLDSLFINDYLVRNGYAYDWAYSSDIKYKQQLAEAENTAKGNRLGLWGDVCHPIDYSVGGFSGNNEEENEPEEQEQSFPPIEYGQVVINEIAWMGTEADYNDEWIELYNTASQSIDLTNSVFEAEDGSPSITLTGNIPANGYYLLERIDEQTISNIPADQIYAGILENDGESLILRDSHGNVIDQVDCSEKWHGGGNEEKRTMERVQEDWQTYSGSGSDAVDANGSLIFGTPRAENSINTEEPEPEPEPELPAPSDDPPVGPSDDEAGDEGQAESESTLQENLVSALDYNYASFSFSIVINELAWMGTEANHSDEWIELYNKSNYNINLASLSLEALDCTPTINLTGVIPANGYYLLERTDDKTVSNIAADQIYKGALGNVGESLILKDSNENIIDQVNCSDDWHAGQNKKEEGEWVRKTMERISPDELGTISENWQTYTGSGSSAIDAGGNPILGTPKAENSSRSDENGGDIDNDEDNTIYTIYTLVTNHITQNTTWTLGNSPYLIYAEGGGPQELLEIAEGITLTIEPGVIVKFKNPGLKVYGTIKAKGTADKPIIFTNYNDDEYGGDIFEEEDDSQFCEENPEDRNKCPQPGDWSGIWFTESSTNSVLDDVVIRYAGSRTRPSRAGATYSFPGVAVGAGIRVEGTSIILRNSTIEHNLFAGVLLTSSPNTIIENSIFQDHLKHDNSYTTLACHNGLRNIAVYIDSSNLPAGEVGPQIRNSTFQNNLTGIYIINNGQSVIENNSFSDNSYPIWVHGSYPQFSNNQIDGNHWDGILLTNLKLNQDYTLGGGSPFINYDYPYDSIIVPEGHTLTIEPGTIIKSFYITSGLKIEGTLIAEGTAEKPIVFTSFYDDEYGGDTNGDGDATRDDARAESWGQIVFTSTSTNSSLNYVVIRYGGVKWGGGSGYKADYVLKIDSSDLTLANSIIENNTFGFYLENSSSQIANTIFRGHQYKRPFYYDISAGLYLASSNPAIDSATFLNNKWGIYIDANSWPVLTNLSFAGNNIDIEDLRPEEEEEGGGVEIIGIFYDGAEEGEADEHVEIKNTGEVAQNLENWTLSDEANHTYIFPFHDLELGESIKIYTNMGTFSYGSGTAIWNNTGDTAYLKDNDGNLVDFYSY